MGAIKGKLCGNKLIFGNHKNVDHAGFRVGKEIAQRALGEHHEL